MPRGRTSLRGELQQFEIEITRAPPDRFAGLQGQFCDVDVEFERDGGEADFVIEPRQQPATPCRLFEDLRDRKHFLTHDDAY